MQIFFHTLKEIVKLRTKTPLTDIRDLRKKIEILVIDDQDVSFLDQVKEHDYSIKHHKDFYDFNTLEKFSVILCDIQGVGKNLNPTSQGAHLVQQIKKMYPFKQVIAFSAASSNMDLMRQLQSADELLKKDADLGDWTEALDRCLKRVGDPVKQWSAVRLEMLENGVSTKTVAHLESEFVRSVLAKDQEKFVKAVKSYGSLSADLVKILLGLGSLIKFFS